MRIIKFQKSKAPIPAKKLFTREDFRKALLEYGKKMAADKKLSRKAFEVLEEACEYNWLHQTEWLGEPILNPAQDMFARQEIIYKTRPDYIIELGVAWGGSLLFYSTLMEVLGGKKVIGVDIFMPDDLVKRLKNKGKISNRIVFINGSSTEEKTLKTIKSIIGKSRKLLIILDSNHTHDHVLKELKMYSPLVGKGFYLVCDDTFAERLRPTSKINRDRPWSPGNSPLTALREFMKENNRFKADTELGNKLLISCNPDGYLKCIKN